MKLFHFLVKLTSWYHTSRSGVLSVVVADVVGQLRTELPVIYGDGSGDSNDEQNDDDLENYDDLGDVDENHGDEVANENDLPWISAIDDWSNRVLVAAQPLVYCALLKHGDDHDDNMVFMWLGTFENLSVVVVEQV